MKKLKVKINSLSPLVHSNVDNAFNYKDPIYRELKKVMAKRKKTEADLERISDLQWIQLLYQKKGKPLALGRWLRKGMIMVARNEKMGKKVEQALINIDDAFLKLPEQKSIDQLKSDDNHRWVRPIPRGVLATNPVFPEYQFETTIEFDENIVDEDDIVRYLTGARIGAGRSIGYGRINIEVLKSEALK